MVQAPAPFPCVSHATSLTSGSSSHLIRECHPSAGTPAAVRSKGESRGDPCSFRPFLSRSQATVPALGLAQGRNLSQHKGPSREQRTRRRKTTSGAWRDCSHPAPQLLTPGPLEMGLAHSPGGKEPPPSCPISPGWASWYSGPSPPSTSQPQQNRGGQQGVSRLLGWVPLSAGQGGVGGQPLAKASGRRAEHSFESIQPLSYFLPCSSTRHAPPALT